MVVGTQELARDVAACCQWRSRGCPQATHHGQVHTLMSLGLPSGGVAIHVPTGGPRCLAAFAFQVNLAG